jgi:glycosyltransferase involved in cell wall biosynthesis
MNRISVDDPTPDLTVVMPCLNESDTVASCVQKVLRAGNDGGFSVEVIVADNGSTDGSPAFAREAGATVVEVAERGYGSALMGGIGMARSPFVLMGDADDSYDFGETPKFLQKLREGHDLVQGCRLPSGGGTVLPGAMPFLHRWWGNPMFSFLARWWFKAPVHDVYCGMRGFRRDFYERLNQRCTGMEFATEMILKASLFNANIAEVPITLHPDGRKSHPPHLRTFRDGWRTLRFYLLFSPRWLFLVPGMLLLSLGLMGYLVALPGLTVFGATFDAHTLLFASLSILAGFQAVIFAFFTKRFAISEGFLPPDARIERLGRVLTLERGLMLGATAVAVGFILLAGAVNDWRLAGFGNLDYAHTMRWVIPGVTLSLLGFQGLLSSFFLSILSLARR